MKEENLTRLIPLNVIKSLYRIFGKDVEFPKRSWLNMIIAMASIAISIDLGIGLIIYRSYSGPSLIIALIAGGLTGCVVSFMISDKFRKRFRFLGYLCILNLSCFSFLLFNFWTYGPIEVGIIYFILVMDTTISFVNLCVILFQTTTSLERGRVNAGVIASAVVAVPVMYLTLLLSFMLYVLYIMLVLIVLYFLFTKIRDEQFISPKVEVKEMLNKKTVTYHIILCGFCFVEGLFFNYSAINPEGFDLVFSFIILPAILFISFIIAGIVFDLYGRRRALSLMVLLLGTYAFVLSLESTLQGVAASSAIYLATLVLNIIAIFTIIADVSVAPSKILPLSMVLIVGSLVSGYLLRNVFISLLLPEFPFIIGSFGLLIISIFLVNTTDLTSEQEQQWNKAMISMYVMSTSGVLLYHKEFRRDEKATDLDSTQVKNTNELVPDLVSSGIVGITQLMQEIIQGKQIIRAIDHYSKKILLEEGINIIVALIVHTDLKILRVKLRKFIEEFEIEFHDALIESTGYDMKRFERTKDLIKKYFGVKYLLGFGEDIEGHSA